MNHQTGKLILISGPSGTGKSTVISRLMRLRDDVCFSVSATTRAPRPARSTERITSSLHARCLTLWLRRMSCLSMPNMSAIAYGTPKSYVERPLR